MRNNDVSVCLKESSKIYIILKYRMVWPLYMKKIAECNLLHDIINPSRRTKSLNRHYSSIIHVYMDTRKGKAKFKNFLILLYSWYSSSIVMRMII